MYTLRYISAGMQEIHIPRNFGSERWNQYSVLAVQRNSGNHLSAAVVKLWHLSGFSGRTKVFTSSLPLSFTLAAKEWRSQTDGISLILISITQYLLQTDRCGFHTMVFLSPWGGGEQKLPVCLLFLLASICPETFWTGPKTVSLSYAAISKLELFMLRQSKSLLPCWKTSLHLSPHPLLSVPSVPHIIDFNE